MAAIAGKDIMIFFKFDGTARALALASNHTLDLQSDTTETSSKDSGIWADSEVSKLRWTASSENFIEGLGRGLRRIGRGLENQASSRRCLGCPD